MNQKSATLPAGNVEGTPPKILEDQVRIRSLIKQSKGLKIAMNSFLGKAIVMTFAIVTLSLVSVQVRAQGNVSPVSEYRSAEVTGTNNDEPQGPPVINLSTSTSSITEGGTAIIDFTLSQAAPDNGLTVHYSISETGNYLYSYIVGSYQVVIPAGEISKEFGFKTYDDEIDEPNGSFTISLTRNDMYTLGTASSVSVNIQDNDDAPEITVGGALPLYDEHGAIARFTIYGSSYFSGSRMINVSVSGVTRTVEGRPLPTSVSLAGTPTSSQNWVTPSGRYDGNSIGTVLEVPIHEDQANSRAGLITVTILPPTNTSDYTIGSRSIGQFYLSRFTPRPTAPLPVVSVSAVTQQAEGVDTYFFKITTSRPFDNPQTIKVFRNNKATFYGFGQNFGVTGFTFPAGETTFEEFMSSNPAAYRFAPNNIDGFAELEIRSGPGYQVAPYPDNYARIDTRRIRVPEGISIIAGKDTIESGIARFQITASSAYQSDHTINVDVSDGNSDFLDLLGPTRVVLPAGEIRAPLSVPLVDDNIDEPDGLITATILPGAGYTVATTQNSASLRVMDDDGTPVIYLSSDMTLGDWIEGHNAEIRIYSSAPVPRNRSIRVRVTDGGTNLYDGYTIRYVQWDKPEWQYVNGERWAHLMINTIADTISEDDGEITVELLSGTGYEVSTTHNTATYTVYDDDDVNEIEVQALKSTIIEGEYAAFRFTPSGKHNNHYRINFSFDDGSGDFIGQLATSHGIFENFRPDGTSPEGLSRGSIQFVISQRSRVVYIPTVDDSTYESDGRVTLTILPNSTNPYTLSSVPSRNSAMVTVLDNDSNSNQGVELSIARANISQNSVEEGNDLLFTVSSSAPIIGSLVANVAISQTNSNNLIEAEFVTGDLTRQVTFSDGSRSALLTISTEDDRIDEPDGEVTASLVASANYQVNQSAASATIGVTDGDVLPILYLSAVSGESTINESVSARFRLRAARAPSLPITVKINVSQTGNVLAGSEGDTTFVLAAKQLIKIVEIATDDDETFEIDGSITVRLLDDDITPVTYTVTTNSERQSGTVQVLDDDTPSVPVVSIAALTTSVDESNTAQFRLTTTTTSSLPITVRYNKSISGGVFDGFSEDSSTIVLANSAESILDISTEDDRTNEPDATITITILGDDNTTPTYAISPVIANQSAKVTVIDDDPLPEFGIAGTTGAKLEPDAARFRLWTTTAASDPVSVRINVTQTGNVLSSLAGEITAIMPAGERQTYFEIATEDDEIAESNGSITVTLLADNNTPESYTLTSRTYRRSATVEIYDDDTTPTITIANATAVTEGTDTNATFAITTSHAVRDTRTVNIAISGATSFIQSGQIPTSITLTRYSLRTALRIPIEDDEIDEADGTITVTISAPTNANDYQIGTPSSAQVSVSDNDEPASPPANLPIVTVTTNTSYTVEGSGVPARFATTQIAPVNGLIVRYRKSHSGDFFPSTFSGSDTVKILAGETFTKLRFATVDDSIEEADGSVTITLEEGHGYRIGNENSFSIHIYDNDGLPNVRISSIGQFFTEGLHSSVSVVVRANRMVFEDTRVNIQVLGATNFIPDGQIPTFVMIPANSARTVLEIPIHDDNVNENDGDIVVAIKRPSSTDNYELRGIRQTSFLVRDNDEPPETAPEISVSTISNLVHGDDGYFFRMTATHASDSDIFVNVKIEQAVTIDWTFAPIETRRLKLTAGTTVYDLNLYSGIPSNWNISSKVDGYVQLTIMRGVGYHVASNPYNQARIDSRRYDAPTGISIIAGYNELYESGLGRTMLFQITASKVSQIDRMINVNLSDGDSDFLREEGLKTVRLPSGDTKAVLVFELIDDDIDEPDGYITATILPGEGYSIAATHNTAKIKVMDNDGAPILYLSPYLRDSSKWIEGQSKRISIRTSGRLTEGTIIDLRITDGGGNLYTGEELVSVAGDNRTYEISTQDDNIVEDDGTITVEILPRSSYTVAPDYQTFTYTVLDDDDINYFTIEALDSTITEGQFAQFRLTPSTDRGEGYQVNFSYNQGGGDFIGEIFKGDGVYTNYFEFNETESTGWINYGPALNSRIVRIPTKDDNVDEADGQITLQLLVASNQQTYSLSSDVTKNWASVTVLDNDAPSSLPVISLLTSTPTIIEGATAFVTLTSDRVAPVGGLLVNFEKNQIGNFFTTSFAGSDTATILAGESTKDLSFVTDDDNFDELDGSITITLAASSNYTHGSTPSITINVVDNDDLPVISIADATAVVEGTDTNAVFTLTASHPSSEIQTINVSVTGVTRFIPTNQIPTTVTFERDSIRTVLSIPIEDDDIYDHYGYIFVKLLPDTNTPVGYTISDNFASQSAKVMVRDNDTKPEISVVAVESSVIGPNPAEFKLSTSTTSSFPITVKYNVYGTNNTFLEIETNNPEKVLIPAFATEKTIQVSDYRFNSEHYEQSGIITVNLHRVTSSDLPYKIPTDIANQSAEVNIMDDGSLPVISVAAVADTVHEPNPAQFRIISSKSTDEPLPVRIRYSHSKNVLEVGTYVNYSPVIIPAGSTEKVLEIDIENDLVSGPNGYIFVQIVVDDNLDPTYRMTHNVWGAEAWVTVVDDDEPTQLPFISISSQTESVVEGENIEFTVTSSKTITDPLVVDVNLNQTNSIDSVDANFIVGGLTRQVYFANGSALERLTILTQDDKVDEPNGTISVSIASNSNYEVGQNSSLSVAVADNDVPMASIRTAAPNLSATEGDLINFGVFLDRVSWQPIAVNVNVTQNSSGGDFINPEDLGDSIHTVESGERRIIFAVRTIDDEVDETDGEITATIKPGNHYTVHNPTTSTNSAGSYFVTARVTDNDETPVIDTSPVVLSITPNRAQVAEGESVAFELRASKTSKQPLPLNLRIDSTNEDFLNHVKTRYAGYLSALRYDARPHGVLVFSFSSIDNEVVDEDFEVVATLLDAEGYVTNTEKNEATVIVTDDDKLKPKVSIRRVHDTIQEGNEASFVIEVDKAVNEDLDVKVAISSDVEGTLIATQRLENIVKISARATSQLLTISTQGNNVDGPDSKITATLQADENYLLPLNVSDHSASITVLDDDVPLISIIAEVDSIGEGEIARFAVSSEVEVVEAVSVDIVVNQTGDVIAGGSGIETVHFEVGSDSKVIQVRTSEDEIDEIEGQITATIIDPSDKKYEVAFTKSASVAVTDNDDPIISIAVDGPTTIIEGEDVKFNLTAKDRAVESDLKIHINITQSSTFTTWRLPRVVIMEAGNKSASVVVVTIDDKVVHENGEFKAEILGGEGYQLGSPNSAKLAIQDNDVDGDPASGSDDQRISVADKIMQELLKTTGVNTEQDTELPEISIVARNDEVAEGEIIRFAIQSSLVPDTDLIVEITIDSPNDSISESTPMRVAIQAGRDTHLLELATRNDNKLESNELITLTINEQPTYTISDENGSASVIVTDHRDWERNTDLARSNGVVIPQLAGRLSAQSLNQITERIQQGFASDGQNILQIAGSEELTGILEQSGDAVNNDALLKDTLFNNSAFAFRLLPDSTGFGSATTWGSGNQFEFQSQGLNNSAISGEMLSSHLGLDVAFNEALISGFTGTYSDTLVEYSALDSTYEYDVQMTGLFPYIGWQNTDRADYLRVVTGLGSGEIGIRQEGNNWDKLTSNLYTTEVSGGLQVYADNDASDHAVSALSLDSGIRTLRYFTEQESDVVGHFDYRQSQSHLTLEGHYAKNLSNGIALIPTAAIGLQGLSGNVTNEFGFILESGISVENPVGWTISGLGRTFFNSEDWSNDSQLQSTLAFDSNNDDLGTMFDVTSSWGVAPTHETESMWERHIFTRNSLTQTEDSQTQISTEFGYGIGILDGSGILTPYNKIDWSDTNQQTIEFGSRVAVGAGISFELKGSRENRTKDEIDHQINFSGSFGW